MKRYKKADGGLESPGAAYNEIKARLMKFVEGPMERQMRVKAEWDGFYKTKNMNAMQFEARWEELSAELEEVGLGKTPLEKYLAYLEKVGPVSAEEIQKDRRPRPDKSGGSTSRARKLGQRLTR